TNNTNTTASVSPPRTSPGNATTNPTTAPSATACQSSLEATWSKRARQAELAGVEHAVRIERLLHAHQYVEGRAECLTNEARPVQSDTVMMAERPAAREHRALSRVPDGAVVAVAVVRFDPSGEREVQAAAFGIAVGLVRRRGHR